MPSAAIVALLLVIGYAAATVFTPAAEADDSSKIIDALQALARAEEKQTESLRRIADGMSKCGR